MSAPFRPLVLAVPFVLCCSVAVLAQCPEKPPVSNFTGPGRVVCPCFVEGEEAGAVFSVPAADLPIEVIRVGVGWGSQFGGAPTSLEAAIRIRDGGLPTPGAQLGELPGPQLTDGFLNEFDLTAFGVQTPVASNPFTVTLEFLNDNAGNFFAPSVVHDGAGCIAGRNVVFAIPGGWSDGCALGVTGNWVFYIVYRPTGCGTDVPERIVASEPVWLGAPSPSPLREWTNVEFLIERAAEVSLDVVDVSGRRVRTLVSGNRPAGVHRVDWDGRTENGDVAAAGVYFVRLTAAGETRTRKLVVAR
ncbi:MAG: FlgD immunoglobulin-like domain containing protein [bacterium]